MSIAAAPERIDAVFAGLTPRQRDRMASTLLVWLQTRGTHNEIAARLDVPPALLLTFTFLLGSCLAATLPAYQVVVQELVPRNQVRALGP